MTDDSRLSSPIPESLRKQHGLLVYPPHTSPYEWAQHLEVLTAEGELSGIDDMLKLIQQELNRLQEQLDADAEPDRHSETKLAAAVATILEHRPGPDQAEIYFALILGYLYGRLTKPGEKTSRESAAHWIIAMDLLQREQKRERGPQSLEEKREAGRQWMREKASEIWAGDHEEELRIGAVAEKVRSMVEDEAKEREAIRDESAKHWPRSLGAIQKAIRPVAPDYAKKPGRPPRK